MFKKVTVAGNICVDMQYQINGYPKPGELTAIISDITKSTGGAVCNNGIDLAKILPDIKVSALGMIGNDTEGNFALNTLKKYGIDTSLINTSGTTSFTYVMQDATTNERTFFHDAAANKKFSEDSFNIDKLDCDLFHIGYILLLDELDKLDSEYGTKMARMLAKIQAKGIKTSIDIVTENSDRFMKVVTPALKYSNYCIINEVEAEKTTGFEIRDTSGKINIENIKKALKKMKELGVKDWAVIHSPEGGYGIDENGIYSEYPSINLPKGYIKGKVGAGDAFCSGVLAGACKGFNLKDSLIVGSCAAAASLSKENATDGVEELNTILKLKDKFQ